MHKLLQALPLALACCLPLAHASLINVSRAPVDITAPLNSTTTATLMRTVKLGDFGAAAGVANNYFIDRYTFTLNGFYDIDSADIHTQSGINAATGLKLTDFKLFTSAGTLLLGSEGSMSTSSYQELDLLPQVTPLGPGNYYLELSGYARSAASNYTYSGNFTLNEAVPEPASIVIMLTGLGLLGLSRRRKPLGTSPRATL
ncbi:MAG: FxDxF family PEP-CTERM protein [Pseudomonadota bacterium]